MQIYYILCKMPEKFKSNDDISNLAKLIKARRKDRALTLKNIEGAIHINCGQLSRFEAGDFKTHSNNLQILCNYLQINVLVDKSLVGNIGVRLESFAARSNQHRVAAEEILNALERLN